MRKTICLLILLHFSLAIIAQNINDYKGPAKMDLQTFWRQAAFFQRNMGSSTTIVNMKKALDNVKQKDPTYDVSSMEQEYQKRKAEIDKQADATKTDLDRSLEAKMNQLSYSGPAKNNIYNFWRNALQASKLSESELNYAIGEMIRAIKSTKEKDASFNTTEMEATLKKIDDDLKSKKLNEVRQFSGDKRLSQPKETTSNDAGSLIEQLFININLNIGSRSSLLSAADKITAYKKKLEKLQSLNYTDALIKHGKFAKANIQSSFPNTIREINKVDDYLKQARENETMEYMYYTIQFHVAYWDACRKIFPEEIGFAEMYKKIETTATKVGTLEQLYAKVTANNLEHIKNTVLPNAVVRDAKLENILLETFNKQFSSTRNVRALKVVLTQNGWTILRNSITGVITGRERSAKLAYKSNDNKCYVLADYVFIKEDYVGSSFTNTRAVFNGLDGIEMLCENVK